MARFIGFFGRLSPNAEEEWLNAGRFHSLANRLGFRSERIGDVRIAFDPKFMSFWKNESAFCLVSGQLIHSESKSAAEDFERLVSTLEGPCLVSDIDEFFRRCRGNFSIVFGRIGEEKAYLATDCLATRPIFVWNENGRTFFSGQMNLARTLGRFSLFDWDKQALLEVLSFGIPLGTRTEHSDLSVLDVGTVAILDKDPMRVHQYRDWRKSRPLPLSLEEQAKRLYEAFASAVSARATRYGGEFCLLSGGMDSRAIATILRQEGYDPLFFNFGAESSQDYGIAVGLAESWNARLVSKLIDAVAFDSVGGIQRIVASVVNGELGNPLHGCRPVWTGDGGSVCLGAVYLDKEIIDAAKRGGAEAATRFVRRNHWVVPRPFLPRASGEKFSVQAVEDVIASYKEIDAVSGLFTFLLKNDQRRHLWSYFNDIEFLRCEPITPFFDQHFLSAIDSCPIEMLLHHRVYTKFFELLPQDARVIGWQTYPGHAPCFIPVPKGTNKQWDQSPRSLDIAARRRDALNIIAALLSMRWPSAIQQPIAACLIALASLSGVRRIDYLVKKSGMLASLVMQCRSAARSRNTLK